MTRQFSLKYFLFEDLPINPFLAEPHMPWLRTPANRPLRSPGVPVVLLPVFPVFVVVVPPDPVLPLSETCAEEVACLTPTRPGADGTAR